ncbi:MAG: penicillin-binding protein activator LpoB [Treponema sp.]|nr:penicillin-binding protein activator LpoB [Treponema sp.]
MKKLFVILVTVFILSACGSTNVKRVESGSQPDLSGYWNDIDVRKVCDALINDCLLSPRVDQAIRASGSRIPMVIVGRFRNASSEQIDTEIISLRMENAIFNSGRLNFVSGGDTRDDIRLERLDQQNWASEETMAKMRRETGADYMMTGSVHTIVDRERNRTVRTYYVTAELTNIETNERMWMSQNSDITKIVTLPANRL